ncbi:MAG: sulfatase-like hydrolase/transferase, partial [Chitinophagia bacterium]
MRASLSQFGILAAAIFLILTFSGAGKPESKSGKPNIIFILADDMGYSDIQAYGGEVMTPHLNSMAGNGIKLRTFYNNTRCCPTRASLLTGQ